MSDKEWLNKEEFFADFDADPGLRAAWERTAFARGVGSALVGYRTAHKLSQRALAVRLGMRPSAVARLELGEHNPSVETLQRLAGVLGLHIVLEVMPDAQRAPLPLSKQLRVVADHTGPSGERLRVAVG